MPKCPHCMLDHAEAVDYCPHTGRPMGDVVARMIGRVIAGKYRLMEQIGQGGMGTIFKAEHTLIGNLVAVKLLHEPYGREREPVERLYREARATGAIGHRNIIKVHDVGETDEGVPFLVMELLEGQSLAELIETCGPLSLEIVFDVAIQILSALHAAHCAGIIHRDLKSENIFLARNEKKGRILVKILDFGISKLTIPGQEALKLTQTGSVLGTPYYMSPEQATGCSDLDERLDIYAAGLIVYEMLLGTLPYKADNYNALLLEISTRDVRSFRSRRGDIPQDLEAVVLKALARNRKHRWPRALDFMEALSAIRDRLGHKELTSRPPPVAVFPPPQEGEPPRRRSRPRVGGGKGTPLSVATNELRSFDPGGLSSRQRKRRRWGIAAGAGVGLVALLVVGFEFGPNDEATAPASSLPVPGRDSSAAKDRSQLPPVELTSSPPQGRVRLVVIPTPPDAQVFVEGRPVPREGIDLPAGGEPLSVEVSAEGYVTETRAVVLLEDLEISIDLAPLSKSQMRGNRRTDRTLDPTKRKRRATTGSGPRGKRAKNKGVLDKSKPAGPKGKAKSLDRLMDNPF